MPPPQLTVVTPSAIPSYFISAEAVSLACLSLNYAYLSCKQMLNGYRRYIGPESITTSVGFRKKQRTSNYYQTAIQPLCHTVMQFYQNQDVLFIIVETIYPTLKIVVPSSFEQESYNIQVTLLYLVTQGTIICMTAWCTTSIGFNFLTTYTRPSDSGIHIPKVECRLRQNVRGNFPCLGPLWLLVAFMSWPWHSVAYGKFFIVVRSDLPWSLIHAVPTVISLATQIDTTFIKHLITVYCTPTYLLLEKCSKFWSSFLQPYTSFW